MEGWGGRARVGTPGSTGACVMDFTHLLKWYNYDEEQATFHVNRACM